MKLLRKNVYNITELISKYNRRLQRLNKQMEPYEDTESLSGHGMWSKGYLQGKIAEIEDIIDELVDLKELYSLDKKDN
jgi:hypothetical protein